jgi:hypothetical protein
MLTGLSVPPRVSVTAKDLRYNIYATDYRPIFQPQPLRFYLPVDKGNLPKKIASAFSKRQYLY